MFVCYAFLTIWLLLHLEMPKALALGLPIYVVRVMVMKKIRLKMMNTKNRTKQHRELK